MDIRTQKYAQEAADALKGWQDFQARRAEKLMTWKPVLTTEEKAEREQRIKDHNLPF